MRKEDLKNGMIVEDREGERFLVLLGVKLYSTDDYANNYMINVTDGYNYSFDKFNDDLTHTWNKSCDIIRVYAPNYMGNIFRRNIEFIELWERKEPKELTITEIEELFGYPIIIKE